VALSGRLGPVHISLPADVQAEVVEADLLPVSAYRASWGDSVNVAHVKTAFDLLKNAAKPAILAGYAPPPVARGESPEAGGRTCHTGRDHAEGERSLSRRSPLSLGCVGSTHSCRKQFLKSGIDVLSQWPSFMNSRPLLGSCFRSIQTLIQIDIDPTEIGKNYPVTLDSCDAGAVLKSLVAELSGRGAKATKSAHSKTTMSIFGKIQCSPMRFP